MIRSRLLSVRLRSAPFDAAHVGAMEPEEVGEGLLADASGLPVGPDALADPALEVAFHPREAPGPPLDGLQTYEYDAAPSRRRLMSSGA